MFCIRIIVFVFLMVFTACATCSQLFPLFRHTTGSTKNTIYFWYWETSIKTAKDEYTYYRTYSRGLACHKQKDYYTASGALAAAGAAFGGVATLLALCHLFVRPKCCLCLGIFVLTFLAFACYTVCVALMADTYTTTSCKGKVTESLKLKDQHYKVVEGFALACCAAGGYLIIMLLELCA